MEKSVSISISGIAFNIEYEAYKRLQEYLEITKEAYKDEEASEEIVADIEARISELVLSWQRSKDEVVSLECIENIITQLGMPEGAEQGAEEGRGERAHEGRQSSYKSRRLYRDGERARLGGVISGIATYLNLDANILRVAVVAFVVITPFFFLRNNFEIIAISLLAYLALWIVIPMAKSMRQKMEMHGDPITVDSLKVNINNELNNISTSEKNTTTGRFFSESLYVISKIVRIIVLVIAFALIISAALLLISLTAFTIFGYFNFKESLAFISSLPPLLVALSAYLSIMTPIVVLFIVIIKLVFKKRTNRLVTIGLVVVWALSWTTSGFITMDTMTSYSNMGYVNEHVATIPGDTLSIVYSSSGKKESSNAYEELKKGRIYVSQNISTTKESSLEGSSIRIISTYGKGVSYRISGDTIYVNRQLHLDAKKGDKLSRRYPAIRISYADDIKIDNHCSLSYGR